MSRKKLFDLARELKGSVLTPADVELGDKWMDQLGIARDEPPAPPAPPARPQDIPEDYYPMLAQIESGTRPYIKAFTSSASGLYQFIKSTWIGEGGKWGPNPIQAFGGLRPTEEEQLQRARSFTEKNARVLRKAGIPINKASLYAAHFFGAGTAVKVISADVEARADHIAGPAPTRANPSILKGKTVGQVLSWLFRKTGAWAR
jgi:hypothetical protein